MLLRHQAEGGAIVVDGVEAGKEDESLSFEEKKKFRKSKAASHSPEQRRKTSMRVQKEGDAVHFEDLDDEISDFETKKQFRKSKAPPPKQHIMRV